MRGEVILLVGGLAVVAALPVLDQQPPPSMSDLLNLILNAAPQDNDLRETRHDKLSVEPTKVHDQRTQTEVASQQPQLPQPQDTPQEEPQPQPQEDSQPQPQDTPQEEPQPQEDSQPQPQDTPQEEPQPQEPQPQPQEDSQPQPQDPSQEESQPQEPETASSEESQVPEGEVVSEPIQVRFQLNPIQVYPQEEDISHESEELAVDEPNLNLQMETLAEETDDGYVVLEMKEEPSSLEIDGTFQYEHHIIPLPLNEEKEPSLSSQEEPYDSVEEETSYEQDMDSFPFEAEELPSELVTVESQEDPIPYDSAELLDLRTHEDFLPLELDEEPFESDYEEVPHGMEEGLLTSINYDSAFPTMEEQPDYDYGFHPTQDQTDYDYGFHTEDNQPQDMPSLNGDGPLEESYHEAQHNSPVDLLSWLVPDFFDEESTDYDESPYMNNYQDDVLDQDSFNGESEMVFESQEVDQRDNWEEPHTYEFFDALAPSDDSFLEADVMMEGDRLEPTLYDGTQEAADQVSFADFYIPLSDAPAGFPDIPQQYPENNKPEDESEERVFYDDENFSVDDGLFHVGPPMTSYLVNEEQDQPNTKMFDDILFPKYSTFEDERSSLLWDGESSEEDSTEYLGEDIPVTILESQPTYLTEGETALNYGSLLEMFRRDLEDEEQVEPWNEAKSLMIDIISDLDAEDNQTPPRKRDYLSDNLDNDAMNNAVLKDIRDNFDIIPVVLDGPITPEYQEPVSRYTEDHPTRPFWVPQRNLDEQFPKIYFTTTDDFSSRKTPAFFDRMNEYMSFSRPLSRQSLKTPIMTNQFTLLNEVLDDDLPPTYLPSPSTPRRYKVMGSDSFSSPRKYSHAPKTSKNSFRDLLQHLNPSFYDDTYINGMAKRDSLLYRRPSFNSLQQYNDGPQQLSYTSPPVPYSAPFEPFQERDFPPPQNYYGNRPRSLSSYTSYREPSSLFREDTMTDMYPHQALRQYDDDYTYTDDLPFMAKDSFRSPRLRFPFYPRPQYSAHFPAYRSSSYDNFYNNGPYHPTPLYPRYAPDYY